MRRVTLYLVEVLPNEWMAACAHPVVRDMYNGNYGFPLDRFAGTVVQLLLLGYTVNIDKADSVSTVIQEDV